MKIHHIGYLVRKIDRSIEEFTALGYVKCGDTVLDEYRQVYICFMEKDGYRIELVSPASKGSDVSGLIKKFGNSPYHICYETEAFDSDLEEMLNRKYMLCSERHEAPALGGRDVCFLIHPYAGLTELLEA